MISQWSIEIRSHARAQGRTVKEIALGAGVAPSTVYRILSGCYYPNNYDQIVDALNGATGVTVRPPEPPVQSMEWRTQVLALLYQRGMHVTDLARELHVRRERVSQVISGKTVDEPIVQAIEQYLGMQPGPS